MRYTLTIKPIHNLWQLRVERDNGLVYMPMCECHHRTKLQALGCRLAREYVLQWVTPEEFVGLCEEVKYEAGRERATKILNAYEREYAKTGKSPLELWVSDELVGW